MHSLKTWVEALPYPGAKPSFSIERNDRSRVRPTLVGVPHRERNRPISSAPTEKV